MDAVSRPAVVIDTGTGKVVNIYHQKVARKVKETYCYTCSDIVKVFLNPEIYRSDFDISLPAVIDKCIQLAPIDTRRLLYKNVVLSGGSTMFKDFHRRLRQDIKKIVDTRVAAYNAHLGSSLGTVVKAFHTKAEEFGASIFKTNPVFKGMY